MEHQKRSKLSGDRISALPEPIIHHILSLLPIKDVKVTSSLSKSWYLLSNSYPSLDFDEPWTYMCNSFSFLDYNNQYRRLCKFDNEPFEPSQDLLTGEYVNYGPKPSEPPQDLLEEYSNYVGESIRRFHEHNNLDIRRFSLPFIYLPGVTNPVLLNTCISSVLENHRVEEFSLNIRYPTEKYMTCPFYDLPPSVFASKSIKVADLQVCSLLHSFDPLLPINNQRSRSNSNLVQLRLSHVTLDESILSSIISTCPLIEELSIIYCKGIKHLRISNLNNLKTLHISDERRHLRVHKIVEIEVPSLQSLEMDGLANVRAFHCPKLTHLVLNCLLLPDFRFQYFLSGLHFLCSLSLMNLSSLNTVQLSSDTLNKLRIVDCRDLLELKIEAPNLLSAEYKGEFAPLATSVHNVTGRWNVSTKYHGSENPSKVEDFLVELRDFASKLKHFECLSVYLCNIQSSSFKEINKGAVLQPAANIDHLNLVLVRPVSRISYPDLLERVLCSCRPRSLSLSLIQDHFPSWSSDDNVVMSICDAIMRQLRCAPCNLARSWVHCVEDLMYVAEDGSEDRLPLGGISVPNLQSSKCAIKFIFKW